MTYVGVALHHRRAGVPSRRHLMKRDGRWHLVQQLKTLCPGWGATPNGKEPELDFDQISSKHPDFGQWAAKRPRQ